MLRCTTKSVVKLFEFEKLAVHILGIEKTTSLLLKERANQPIIVRHFTRVSIRDDPLSI